MSAKAKKLTRQQRIVRRIGDAQRKCGRLFQEHRRGDLFRRKVGAEIRHLPSFAGGYVGRENRSELVVLTSGVVTISRGADAA